MQNITPIGRTNWRNSNQAFGIKDNDRLGHIYLLGKTGSGKSTLLQTMAISDIERGNGCCVIDPHGDVAEHILNYVPKGRINDVIYFNATDVENPIGFNPLWSVEVEKFSLIASNLISTFKKIWSDSWGPRLEHILRFCLLSLLYYPTATLLDVQLLLVDPFFRRKVLNHVTDPPILNFWTNEFDKYSPQLKSEAIAPILNKVGILLSSIPLRNIIGQQISTFKMQDVLDQKKILLCNLAKGEIGEDASSIMGSMLVTAIQLAAMHRSIQKEEERIPFYLYVDEMHSFISLSFADILAEARKYKLSLFLTHQYIDQINEKIRAAIFGNVGTLISFRVGAEDAKHLVNEFHPPFDENDFVNLPKYAMYIKLMIDGATSKPFSAQTVATHDPIDSCSKEIIYHSRQSYGTDRTFIEKSILEKYLKQPQEKESTLFD